MLSIQHFAPESDTCTTTPVDIHAPQRTISSGFGEIKAISAYTVGFGGKGSAF